MSFVPFASAAVLSAAEMSQNRVKTDLTFPPVSIDMIRQWSSSFTQHNAVRASLWKMPRSYQRSIKRERNVGHKIRMVISCDSKRLI